MLIFLDIDGVLRRSTSQMYGVDSDLIGRFEAVLRRFPDLEVVIASSWKNAFSLESLRSHFSADVRLRVLGTTPNDGRSGADYSRHREVVAYLRSRGCEDESWIAIDDQPEHYPPDVRLVVTASERGFDEAAAEELVRRAREAG